MLTELIGAAMFAALSAAMDLVRDLREVLDRLPPELRAAEGQG